MHFIWVPDSSTSIRELLPRRPLLSCVLRPLLQVNGLMDWFPVAGRSLQLTFDRWFACILYSSICCPKPPVQVIFFTGFYSPCLQFIYLKSGNSFSMILRSFTSPFFLGLADAILDEFFVFTLTIWPSFRFTSASLKSMQFSHVPLSTGINVSSMHCSSINARKLVI